MTAAAAGPGSVRYLGEVHHLLERLNSQLPAIETTANWVAASIAAGGMLHIVGTGHSHMVAEEVFYRAGGLVAVNPILDPSLLLDRGALKNTKIERLHDYGRIVIDDSGLTATDLLVVVSNSGRNAVPVDMALRAKEIGSKVVAITSRQHSEAVAPRHHSGKKLLDVADLVIDNCVAYGDAAVAIDGLTVRAGPLSTIAGVAIINAVTVRAAELLAAAGHRPEVLTSSNAHVEVQGDLDALGRARARVRAL